MAHELEDLADAEWALAFRQMLAEHDALVGAGTARQASPRQEEVYVWPENQPAAALWLLTGWSAWETTDDGSWHSLRVGLLLEFAREMRVEDPTLHPLTLVQQAQVIAGTVAPLQRAWVAEQRRQHEARERLAGRKR